MILLKQRNSINPVLLEKQRPKFISLPIVSLEQKFLTMNTWILYSAVFLCFVNYLEGKNH